MAKLAVLRLVASARRYLSGAHGFTAATGMALPE
jgi:hypothetical protein